MDSDKQKVSFRQLAKHEEKPYELLLLADPSKQVIDEYLEFSQIFVAEKNKNIIGTIVLQTLVDNQSEIKNVAVLPELQGQGIGKLLIENILQIAKNMNFKTIQIGTANSSIGQLYLYQKLGFDILEIKKNFFIDNYSEPIYENGLQAKDMILLSKTL